MNCTDVHPEHGACLRSDGPHRKHRNPSGSWGEEDEGLIVRIRCTECDHVRQEPLPDTVVVGMTDPMWCPHCLATTTQEVL